MLLVASSCPTSSRRRWRRIEIVIGKCPFCLTNWGRCGGEKDSRCLECKITKKGRFRIGCSGLLRGVKCKRSSGCNGCCGIQKRFFACSEQSTLEIVGRSFCVKSCSCGDGNMRGHIVGPSRYRVGEATVSGGRGLRGRCDF